MEVVVIMNLHMHGGEKAHSIQVVSTARRGDNIHVKYTEHYH